MLDMIFISSFWICLWFKNALNKIMLETWKSDLTYEGHLSNSMIFRFITSSVFFFFVRLFLFSTVVIYLQLSNITLLLHILTPFSLYSNYMEMK